jgi:hypothetical protein
MRPGEVRLPRSRRLDLAGQPERLKSRVEERRPLTSGRTSPGGDGSWAFTGSLLQTPATAVAEDRN